MANQDEVHATDTLLNTALTLFMELASDNLPEDEIILFNQEFNHRGLLTEFDPNDEWEADVGFPASNTDYAEIWVGLANAEQEYDHLFARMLLSRNLDDKRCHITWLPSEGS